MESPGERLGLRTITMVQAGVHLSQACVTSTPSETIIPCTPGPGSPRLGPPLLPRGADAGRRR